MTLPLLLSISANAYALELNESVQLYGCSGLMETDTLMRDNSYCQT